MSGAIPSLPQYAFMAWCLGTALHLPLLLLSTHRFYLRGLNFRPSFPLSIKIPETMITHAFGRTPLEGKTTQKNADINTRPEWDSNCDTSVRSVQNRAITAAGNNSVINGLINHVLVQ
jgi:hypothetical protein